MRPRQEVLTRSTFDTLQVGSQRDPNILEVSARWALIQPLTTVRGQGDRLTEPRT